MSGRLPPPRPQRSSGSLVTGPPSPAPSAASAVPISVPTSPTLAAAKPKASSARGNSSSGVGFGAGSGPTRGPSPASSPSPSPSHTPHSPSPGSSSPVPIHSPGHSAGEPNGKAPMAGAGAGPKVAVKVAVKRGASHRAPRKAPPAGALDDSEYDPSSPAFASPTPVRSGLSSSSSVASSPSSSSSSTHVTGAAPAAVPSTSPAGSRPAQAPVSASKPVPVAAAAGSSSAAAAGASLLAQKTTKAASPSPSSPSSPSSSSSSISDAEAALRKRALPPTPQGGDVNQPTPSSPVPPPLSSKPTSPSLPASSPSSSSSQIPESPLASSSHSSAASSSASAASAPGSPVPAPRSGRNSPGLQHSVSVSSLPLSGSGSTSFSSFHNPGPMSPKPALPPKPKLISSPSLSSSSVAQFAGSSSSSSSSSSSGGGKPMLPNRPSSFSLTVGQDKAVLKSKQKTITPEDVDKISEALKKFGRANKQFTAVATMIISKADLKLKAKGKDKDKSADQIQSLRTQMEASKNQLKTPNDSFATELRDFKDTSDLLTTLKFLTRAAELTSFAAQLVAIGKALTLILEDDTLFKQMLTAISTTRDSLFELVEIYSSYDLGEDLSTNVSTAANNVEQSYNELVETRSDGNTQLIQSGKRLEIEAVARACVLALTKFVNSFGGRLTQNILLEAKVSSSTIVQLAATLNDLANTEHNLLSRKEIRNVILQDASSVKDTFLQFLDVAKREVSNPTPKTALIVQQASENVRNHIRQILSHINAFYAFTPNRSSASATDDNGLPEPSAVDLERAEKVCAIPDPIVPPPPPKEEESNQVPTCADSAPDIENIWEEPEDNDSNIQLTDANVVRIANLNKLIERLTSPSVHDLKFRDTFIATYRSFTTPEALLKKLIQRYTVPPKYQDQTRNIQLRICNVLKHWVETQFYDFGDSMQEKLFEFLDILELNAFYAKFTQKIRAFIQRKKEEEQNAKNEMINLTVEGTIPLPPANILFVFDEEEIARQLTLVDFSVYSSIQPVELLNQAWNKPKYKHRSKNVLTLITRSTNITLWAANIILWQSTLKDRTRAMTKLINIAEHLRKMNNFSSLMAIIAGINMAPVFRLKFTKQLLPESTQDIFQKLGDLMDPLMSYSNYRNALRHVNPPCVPFLGVYLSDITFVEDGNPDFINGLINYRKRELDYNVIQDIQKFQNIGYNFVLVDNIAHFLTELPAVTDNEELYQLSLTREPRNCTLESLT